MSNVIEVDFEGAPPAQGGRAVHIPRGQYAFRIIGMGQSKTRGTPSKQMITAQLAVNDGEQKGAHLEDRFVFPATAEDTKYGIQRFNAFLQALGANVKGKMKIDLDALPGKLVLADVDDNVIPATDQYPEKTVSAPVAYYNIKTLQADNAAPAKAAAPAAPPQPAPETAPEDPTVAAAPPQQDATEEAATKVEEAIDSLFS